MYIHTVTRGESLWKIATPAKSNPQELMTMNGLAGASLQPGLHLLVPGTTPSIAAARIGKRNIETNGYLVVTGAASDTANIRRVAGELTYVSVFSHQVNADGTLTYPSDTAAVAAAKAAGTKPLLVVSNFDGNRFNSDTAHAVLSDTALTARLTTVLLEAAQNRGYSGINVYFQHLNPADRAPFSAWVSNLVSAAHPHGLTVSVALGPKSADDPQSAATGAHDYRALGQAADFVMVLSYGWAWPGSPPTAIAPVPNLQAVLRYVTSVIDSQKTMMGAALYGYDWPLPHPQGGSAIGISNNLAQNQGLQYGRQIQWNSRAEAPWYRYRLPNGQVREVWFEDAASMQAKLALIYSMNLRGISYWELSDIFPQNWYLLRDNFVIRDA